MDLKEGDAVMVAMIMDVRSLKRVEVSAASEKDWEMLVSVGVCVCWSVGVAFPRLGMRRF